MSFSVSTTLETQVSQSSLRSARSQIESELGDVQVGVDGSNISSQLSGGALPDGGMAAAGGGVVADKLDEQTEWLQDIHDVVEQSAVSGGGGGGGFLSNILPGGGGGGGGGGFLSGLLTGGLALKAKNVLSVNGKLATKARNVLSVTGRYLAKAASVLGLSGALSLSATRYLGVAGVLTLTAAGILAVQGRYETQAQETLAVGGVLSVGAAGVLAMTGALSLPAASVIAVTGLITLGVAEIVEILPDGPGPTKTDGVRDSTATGATSFGDGTQIYDNTTGPLTTDLMQDIMSWETPDVEGSRLPDETVAQIRAGQGESGSQSGGNQPQQPQPNRLPTRQVVLEVKSSPNITVNAAASAQAIRDRLREANLDPDAIERVVQDWEQMKRGI